MKKEAGGKERKREKKGKVWPLCPSGVNERSSGMTFITPEDLRPVIEGDAKARGAFVRQYWPLVKSISGKIGTRGDDFVYDDVVMALWEAVFSDDCRIIRCYAGKGSFPGYLKRCLSYRALDIGRKRTSLKKRHNAWAARTGVYAVKKPSARPMVDGDEENRCHGTPVAENDYTEEHDSPENAGAGPNRNVLARELIDSLAEPDRLLLTMLVVENVPAEKVRTKLGIKSVTTVYTRKNRLLAKLRKRVLKLPVSASAV